MFFPKDMLLAPNLLVPRKAPAGRTRLLDPFGAKWTHWIDFEAGWRNKVNGEVGNTYPLGEYPRSAYNPTAAFNRFGSYTGFKRISPGPFFYIFQYETDSTAWFLVGTTSASFGMRPSQANFGATNLSTMAEIRNVNLPADYPWSVTGPLQTVAAYCDTARGHLWSSFNDFVDIYENDADAFSVAAPEVDNGPLFLSFGVGRLFLAARGEGELSRSQFRALARDPYQFLTPA